MHPLTKALLASTTVGVGAIAYGSGYELRAFTLRRVDVPTLPPGSAPLKVLHISDAHMRPLQARKQRWLRDLIELD